MMYLIDLKHETCFKNYLNTFHRILDILAKFSFEGIYTVYLLKVAGEIKSVIDRRAEKAPAPF